MGGGLRWTVGGDRYCHVYQWPYNREHLTMPTRKVIDIFSAADSAEVVDLNAFFDSLAVAQEPVRGDQLLLR